MAAAAVTTQGVWSVCYTSSKYGVGTVFLTLLKRNKMNVDFYMWNNILCVACLHCVERLL